jgi:DNA-directed RNA polymerase
MSVLLAEASKQAQGNKPNQAVKWSRVVGFEVTAYLTLKAVLDSLGSSTALNKVAHRITNLMVDEIRFRIFEEQEPQLKEYRMKKFNTSNYAHKKRSLMAAMNYADVDTSFLDQMLSETQKLRLGVQLLDCLIQATGLVKIHTVRERLIGGKQRKAYFKSRLMVMPTEKTLSWLSDANAYLEGLTPVMLPMAVPPKSWGPKVQGGYWFTLAGRVPFIRIRQKQAALVKRGVYPEVYEAVNALQDTAWKINEHVWKLIQEIRTSGAREIAEIAPYEPLPLPEKPEDIATNEDARRQWRFEVARIKEANYIRRQKVISLSQVLSVVERVSGLSEFYFPWNLDWRGRLYPVAYGLNPQGNDASKALLTFAHGKPVGAIGSRYLAIHGANMLGEDPVLGLKLDKETLDVREGWAHSQSDRIRQVAEDPWSDMWWAKADKSLPVAQDGSCNGLQHYAAMLRDEVTGKAVNLTAGDRPEDVYQAVSDKVTELLVDAAAEDDNALAQLWLKSGLVDRKLVKRPCMTFPYGSSQFGFTDQTLQYLELEDQKIFGRNLQRACRYMAETIWKALQQQVSSAYQVMSWMQAITRKIMVSTPVKNRTPLAWFSPVGFPVIQGYWSLAYRRIRTQLAGSTVWPSVFFDADDVALHRQVNGVAPNFIHSCDAAALIKTVNHAVCAGITDFGMVHDSYATVPADAGLLADITRIVFHEMYTETDVLENFYQDCADQYDGKTPLPAPPRRGSLDLDEVLTSDYFFH